MNQIVAGGLNYKTAPIAMRERVGAILHDSKHGLAALFAKPTIQEIVLLTTCNRIEWYCAANDEAHCIVDWLGEASQIDPHLLQAQCYWHRERSAVIHALRVASGLDSMVVGEPQIFGQMKQAFQSGREMGTLGGRLDQLFQYVFSVTKKVRTQTGIGQHPVSIAYAALQLARQIFSDLTVANILFIGAGEVIQLCAQHFSEQGVRHFCFANRTRDKAQDLAERFAGQAVDLHQLPQQLAHADIVVTATASVLPLLGKGMVETALQARRHKPMFMVDLAMPRDIEPQVNQCADVYLYCLEDLQTIIADSLQTRSHAAIAAEDMVQHHAKHFEQWLQSLDAVDMIKQYRAHCNHLRDETRNKALAALHSGRDPAQIIQQLAHTLTQKLMHHPTQQLRQAAYHGHYEVLDIAQQLLLTTELCEVVDD